MKKILFILVACMFTVSVSAHEQTKSFHKDVVGTSFVSNTSVYNSNNGGLIQFIYNVFHKVGQVFYTSTNDPKEKSTEKNS